ncbi:unnamed protein product, partial [Laminaria digitata]
HDCQARYPRLRARYRRANNTILVLEWHFTIAKHDIRGCEPDTERRITRYWYSSGMRHASEAYIRRACADYINCKPTIAKHDT